ncbi:zf-HC2 domain-containing protein [soil metagenome]
MGGERRADAPGGLSCRELVELVTEYLEDVLDTETRRRFEAHIAACKECTGYLAQMRQTLQVLGGIREGDIAAEVKEALLEAFREWHEG